MPASVNDLVERVRMRLAEDALRELTDDVLLNRFLHQKDQRAFATLVERHAALVLSVCRRVLGIGPDAEDAFQATFLVLARRGNSIRWERCIRGWLYRVAMQVSRRSRQRRARQHQLEQAWAQNENVPPGTEPTWAEGLAHIDQEIDALPEKYRSVLLACCLEGKSRDEAGQELGLTGGQVKGLLERARELLRSRLARRGIVLPATLLALLLQQTPASAVTPPLLTATTQMGLAFASGQATTVPPAVLALVQASLAGFSAVKSLGILVLTLLLTVLAVGGFWLVPDNSVATTQAANAPQPPLAPPETPSPEMPSPEMPPRETPPRKDGKPDKQEDRRNTPVRGRIKSVNAEEGKIVVVLPKLRGQPEEEGVYSLLPGAKVTVRGQPGALIDLTVGDNLVGRFAHEQNGLTEVTSTRIAKEK